MAEACVQWRPADKYFVTGTGTDLFLRPLLAAGFPSDDIVCLGDASGAEIVDALAKRPIESTMILGMGNIAGPGMSLADFFQQTKLWSAADQLTAADPLPQNHVVANSQPTLVRAA
jgi:hypothetical protein